LVVTNSGSTQEEWKVQNLCRLPKKKCCYRERSISIAFTNEVLNIVVRHDAYSFLHGYFGYHQISIATQDKYKTMFVIDWGAFTLVEIGQNVTVLFMIIAVFILPCEQHLVWFSSNFLF
jgi:hypothetical protein